MNTCILRCTAMAALLAGCATPQIALDEANHGLSLSVQSARELAFYQDNRAALESFNQQMLTADAARDEDLRRKQVASDQLDAFSGADSMVKVKSNLRSRVALLEADQVAGSTRAVQVDVQAVDLAAGLPPLAPALNTTGKAFGALGTELPFKERAALAVSFYQAVRKTVKENRDAAASMTAAAEAKAKAE